MSKTGALCNVPDHAERSVRTMKSFLKKNKIGLLAERSRGVLLHYTFTMETTTGHHLNECSNDAYGRSKINRHLSSVMRSGYMTLGTS